MARCHTPRVRNNGVSFGWLHLSSGVLLLVVRYLYVMVTNSLCFCISLFGFKYCSFVAE